MSRIFRSRDLMMVRISSDAVHLGMILLLLLCTTTFTSGLPSGFIAEVVSDDNAVSGTFAQNPKTGDPLLLLVSKTGKVRALEDPDNSMKSKTILSLEGQMCTNTERGLQNVVVHPDFMNNRYVYLFYTKLKEGCLADKNEPASEHPYNVIARFVMDPESLMLDFDTREELWRGAPLAGYAVHNGGAMLFGNDGKLYVTHGDGGIQDNAQDLSIVHGSLLRLNDDGSTPDDNPYTTASGFDAHHCGESLGRVPVNSTSDAVCSEIFANGFRNPFRVAIDSDEKEKVRFSVQDVGAKVWEEISYAGTDYAGTNYGWKPHEGPCLRHSDQECPVPESISSVEPFYYYSHRSDKSGCISGAAFVPSGLWPEEHRFLFADFVWYTVYSLVEEPENECRTCSPPVPRFRNETFFKTTRYPGEGKNEAKVVDMFFGPYKDTQALYIVKYGNHDTVLRIRYTGIHDEPPSVNFTVSNQKVDVNETVQFDGSGSYDPEGEEISFKWFFGDRSTSKEMNPSHYYEEPGEYKVTLFVTDILNQEQQKSATIVVGDPPNATILSPAEGDEFYVGQVIRLEGKATYLNGTAFKDSQLQWEVHKHHDDHYHPFLDPTFGNNIELSPAPEPEDFYASTNSYLEVILYATDDNGLTRKISRNIQPSLVQVGIDSNLAELNIEVNDEQVSTSSHIVSWKDQQLYLIAKSDSSYRFVSWSDGVEEENRFVTVNYSDPVFKASYCALNGSICSDEVLCCSGYCRQGVNAMGDSTSSASASSFKVSETELICSEEPQPPIDSTPMQTASPTIATPLTGAEKNIKVIVPELETKDTELLSPSQTESAANDFARINPFFLVLSVAIAFSINA